MTSRRPGSGRSTHGAWSLDPNDQGPKIAGSRAAKISLTSGLLLWLVKWAAAAMLAGAGIWGGVTWVIIVRETKWRWIPVAIAVEAVIVAAAIVIPEHRPKMLLGAGTAVFVTAVTVAFLIPSVWCSGSWTGGPGVCSDFPLWGRILVAGVGLVVGFILASFARMKPDRGGTGGDGA